MGTIVLKYPTHIRIEPTQGCNRSCLSCPVSPSRSRRKFMTMETMSVIVDRLDERVKRVDFSMHGEPLLNKHIVRFVDMVREKLPKVQISIVSNVEAVLDPDILLDLYSMGLNFIHADVYTKKVKERFIDILKSNKEKLNYAGITASWFRKGGLNIWGYHGGKNKDILVSDESEGFNVMGGHSIRNIHTFGGSLPHDRWKHFGISMDQFPMIKKCTEPMKCAPIDIHGNVVLCCADASKSVVCGSLLDTSMEDIWNGEVIQKARFVLSRGRRDIIPPCYFCSRPSYRVGLWPYEGPAYKMSELRMEFFKENHISSQVEKTLSIKKEIDEISRSN